ncbi:hypothetical protein JRO89_XS06G0105000 [Xanthoceras sorbifolium]|uniref:Gnk2-homologous domain-containing protein n=1 Tax=Xanthoceras sorbifolium TaxID=99658 RepID=A0ABQ8HXY8_9ROSI|nr:hypothetical protein JRO89_XS06G0105000 [Xanthoceras sorbifolium]
MEPDTCRNCINEASNNITSICPKYLIAIAGFDDRGFNNCMLRYANYGIFGVMESAPYFFVHSESNITENLVEFNQTRNRLLERLISAAAARGSPHNVILIYPKMIASVASMILLNLFQNVVIKGKEEELLLQAVISDMRQANSTRLQLRDLQ